MKLLNNSIENTPQKWFVITVWEICFSEKKRIIYKKSEDIIEIDGSDDDSFCVVLIINENIFIEISPSYLEWIKKAQQLEVLLTVISSCCAIC